MYPNPCLDGPSPHHSFLEDGLNKGSDFRFLILEGRRGSS